MLTDTHFSVACIRKEIGYNNTSVSKKQLVYDRVQEIIATLVHWKIKVIISKITAHYNIDVYYVNIYEEATVQKEHVAFDTHQLRTSICWHVVMWYDGCVHIKAINQKKTMNLCNPSWPCLPFVSRNIRHHVSCHRSFISQARSITTLFQRPEYFSRSQFIKIHLEWKKINKRTSLGNSLLSA